MASITERQRIQSGERIRQARLDLGWTQEDLAQATGFHANSVVKWENGQVQPRPHYWKVISEQLGRPIWWLRASDLAEEFTANGRDRRSD
jgi:transcriptional regulator with XRE-family HTH domain